MPDTDAEIHKTLGVLLERSEAMGASMEKLATGVDIIRTDQINSRLEQEFLKTKMVEASDMMVTVNAHDVIIKKIIPMMDTIEDVDNAHKFGKKSVKVVGWLGAAGVLTPFWIWLKSNIHLGH